MAKRKPKGLGDTVEQITTATGIKAVVDAVSNATGINCGCDARKEFLNKIWSYRKPNCLNDEDIEFLLPYFQFKKETLTPKEQWRIKDIYKAVFNEVIQDSNCASCWRDTLNDLRKVYETQQDA
jgi:hypothetical protein